MIDDLTSLRAAVRAGRSFGYVFFWGHRAPGGQVGASCLAQWWPCAFTVDAVWGIALGAGDERASDPLRWEGENLLGFALMRARATLRGGHES